MREVDRRRQVLQSFSVSSSCGADPWTVVLVEDVSLASLVALEECGIANNNPRKKQKRAPKQEQPNIEGDGGGGESNPGKGDETPPK